MTRTWPVPRISCDYSPRPTAYQRVQSGLHSGKRRQLQISRDDALAQLRSLDVELDRLSARRVALLDKLEAMRDRLWPEAPACRGRRPPTLDKPPLPPMVENARMTEGRGLRGLCLTILGRHGALSLPDMHALVHRYGYGILGPHPVKTLADAMAYEVRCGRAVRVRRGVYDLSAEGRTSGFRRSPDPRRIIPDLDDPVAWDEVPVDPDLRSDPDRWIPDAWPDPADAELAPECAEDLPSTADTTAPGQDREPTSDPSGPTTSTEPLGSDSVQIRTRGASERSVGSGEGAGSEGGETGDRDSGTADRRRRPG